MNAEPEDKTLPCFKCGKVLPPVGPDRSDRNQPYYGLTFETHGQYGSTVFDPMDGSKLEINICDECLVQGKDAILFQEGIPDREWTSWEPPVKRIPT